MAQSSAGRVLQTLKSADRKRMALLMRNAHAIAKQNRPFTDYVWLTKLDAAKGLEIGSTYLNEKAAMDFIHAISDHQLNELTHAMDGRFFSFMMDGSTDISGTEQETLYVRFANSGQLHMNFLHIGSPRSTTSEDLHQHVCQVFEETGIKANVSKGKLVGMGSDGAANMMGRKKGLAKLMKDDNPEMISIHCLCHRLELAFRDAFKSAKLYEKLLTLMIGLHYFYKRSPKQKKGLLEAIKVVGIKGLLPPKVTGTRWLGHISNGIDSLCRTYTAYDVHLSTASHGNAKAEGLAKLLLNRELMAFVLLLQDMLKPLRRLSLQLQKVDASLADAAMWMESTVDALAECKNRCSEALQDVMDDGTYKGVTLKGRSPTMRYKEDLIDRLVDAIKDRFENHLDQAVINATRILNFKAWPQPDSDNIEEFGVDCVKAAVDHYSTTLEQADVDLDAVLSDWSMLKRLLYKRHGSAIHSVQWPAVHQEFGDLKDILILTDLLLSLPPTTVTCETSFSQMKLIKTSRRARLSERSLNALMRVKLESPEIECFDPEVIVDRWLVTPQGSKRRPSYKKRVKADAITVTATVHAVTEPDQPGLQQAEMLIEPQPLVQQDAEHEEDINKLFEADSDYFSDSDFQGEEDNCAKIATYAAE